MEASRETPAVTLITRLDPAAAGLLSSTEASLLRQSLQDYEWLVVPPDELNTLEKVRAPYVGFLHGGARLEPTALEKLVWFLDRHPQYAFARGATFPTIFRKEVLLTCGGVTNEGFWQRCLARRWWGGTIPEFLGSPGSSDEQAASGRVWRNGIRLTGHSQGLRMPAVHPLANPNDKKRLLLLAPHLEIGGADKFNLDLIERLQNDHSYQVTVATTLSSSHPLRRQFERLTPDVFTLNTFLTVDDYASFVAYLIRSRSPDTVLIANSRLGYDLLPTLRTETGSPSFADYLHIEDPNPDGYPERSIRYAGFLDKTIVSSEYLKSWLMERGRTADDIEVCTTNIDADVWDRSRYDTALLRAKYGVPEGLPVVAYVARLCAQKRPDLLARVLRAVRDRGGRFVGLIVGDGEYRPWLESFVASHGLQDVRLLGALPNDQVREILAISDIYFMPSKVEGIALALYEAMAMGVVPLSVDAGGQRELVVPQCGILVKPSPGESEEYVESLYGLLNDETRRRSMAFAARRRICEDFTLQAMGERMASIFQIAAQTKTFEPEAARMGIFTPVVASDSQRSRINLLGPLATLFLLCSPRNFKLKMSNLGLLGRVIVSGERRWQLANLFDASYYVSNNADLKGQAIAPLFHYAVQGYLENRQPSPHFSAEEAVRRDPELATSHLNPMLMSILRSIK